MLLSLRTVTGWFVALVALTLAGPQIQAEDAPHWKFQKGDKLHYSRTQDRVMDTSNGGQKIQQKMVRITDLTAAVTGVHPDGSASVMLTIDRIRLTQKSPQADVEYDSAAGKEDEGRAAQLARSLELLVGAAFTYTMTPQGEIRGWKPSEKTAKMFEELPALGRQSLTNESLKLLAPTLPLPDVAWTGGTKWNETVEVADPTTGTRKLEITYTYAGSEEKAGRRLDRIDLEYTVRLVPGEGRLIKVEAKPYKGKGVAYFDRAAGRLVLREDRDTMTMTMELGSRRFEQQAQSKTMLKLTAPKAR